MKTLFGNVILPRLDHVREALSGAVAFPSTPGHTRDASGCVIACFVGGTKHVEQLMGCPG